MIHARGVLADGMAPGKSFEEVADDMRANLIPGAYLIPAAVGEISRVQQRGYPIIYVPRQF
jgi:hypothetical protein